MKNKRALYNLNLQQIMAIAEAFAELLRSGDTVLLFGEIGSGKTFFSRSMIQKMMKIQGIALEDIPSPTFTIVQIYDTISPSVWHLDLYRILDSEEIIDLDIHNALEENIFLIEWPQNMGSYIPKRNISIIFEETDGSFDTRNITFEFNIFGWEHIITGLIERSIIRA